MGSKKHCQNTIRREVECPRRDTQTNKRANGALELGIKIKSTNKCQVDQGCGIIPMPHVTRACRKFLDGLLEILRDVTNLCTDVTE